MAAETTCNKFESLNSKIQKRLKKETLNAIEKMGFQTPTPVQSICIPLILSNKDVVAEAVTGSGKTLAFVVPVIEMLQNLEAPLKKHDIGAIILTPTRELANQIANVVQYFTDQNAKLTHISFVGGKNMSENCEKFLQDGGHIIIATVGRFKALLNEEKMNLKKCLKTLEILILDEADRLLSERNFEQDLTTILSFLPKQRRTSLFSATQTDKIEAFVRAGLRNPVQVVVREKKSADTNTLSPTVKRTPDSLKNYYLVCEGNEKLTKLVGFLRKFRDQKIILFFNTCACVDYYTKLLAILLKNVQVISIHGQMKKKRLNVFNKFQSWTSGVLLCTDVMSRGIDIPKVDWVLQYDPPSNAQSFVHRCGRTARMGSIGNAIIFLLPNETAYIEFVSINQKVPLEKLTEIPTDTADVTNKVRKHLSKDRDLYEKSIRAFVSFIQSYQKHECSIIFQYKELNIGKLASGFGLLHLPKMPELINTKVEDFTASKIDPNTIKYTDKIREAQRLVKFEKLKEARKEERQLKAAFKKNESWSKKKEKLEKKTERKEKKKLKRKYLDTKEEEGDSDLEDLLREGRLVKKLKKGKITKQQFEDQMKTEGEEDDMESD